jgi:hypothetical protein
MTNKPPPDLIFRAIRAAKNPGTKHSPLYRWMWRYYDPLERAFREHAPSWSAMADVFREEGLHDRLGKPPTAKTASQTWRRVCVAMEKVKEAKAHEPPKPERAPTPPPGPGEIAYGVRKVEPPAPPDAGERPAGGSLDDLLAEVRKGQDWWPEPRSED